MTTHCSILFFCFYIGKSTGLDANILSVQDPLVVEPQTITIICCSACVW